MKCTDCGFESNTYDPILDISLEINRAASVEKALQRYTAGEALDGANKYRCPKQKRFVRAVKRITIEVGALRAAQVHGCVLGSARPIVWRRLPFRVHRESRQTYYNGPE